MKYNTTIHCGTSSVTIFQTTIIGNMRRLIQLQRRKWLEGGREFQKTRTLVYCIPSVYNVTHEKISLTDENDLNKLILPS